LEYEAAGAGAVFAARNERIESVGDVFCGFASDLDPVMAEKRLKRARKEEIQRSMACQEVFDPEAIHWFVELGVEVVDPEFVEIAKNDIGRTMRDEVQPVVKCLLVVL